MAAAVSVIFWLQFYTVGGSGFVSMNDINSHHSLSSIEGFHFRPIYHCIS